MVWVFFLVVAVLVVGVTAALVSGRWSADPMADPVASTPDVGLPDRFVAADVSHVRFDTALRGYRMDQVDDVVDRLQDRIAELETGGSPGPVSDAMAEPVDERGEDARPR